VGTAGAAVVDESMLDTGALIFRVLDGFEIVLVLMGILTATATGVLSAASEVVFAVVFERRGRVFGVAVVVSDKIAALEPSVAAFPRRVFALATTDSSCASAVLAEYRRATPGV
jgi:hypothetical protein